MISEILYLNFDSSKTKDFLIEEIKVDTNPPSMTYQNTNVEKQTKSATTDWEDLQQLWVENSFKFDFNSTSSNLLKDIHKFVVLNYY